MGTFLANGSGLRSVAERFARGRILWRRLPADFDRAPLCYSPDAALKLLKPGRDGFDDMLLRLADEHVETGTTVWDIGANVGVFSLAAAVRGAEVVAIEPDNWLYGLLRKTAKHRLNQQLSLQPVCVAVSDQPGIATLSVAARGRSANFLSSVDGSSQTGGVRERRLVPVLDLDSLLQDNTRPNLIKIDVERSELNVLKGARRLLLEVRPKLVVEVGRETRKGVVELLQGANYSVSDYRDGQKCVQAGGDLLALPQ